MCALRPIHRCHGALAEQRGLEHLCATLASLSLTEHLRARPQLLDRLKAGRCKDPRTQKVAKATLPAAATSKAQASQSSSPRSTGLVPKDGREKMRQL